MPAWAAEPTLDAPAEPVAKGATLALTFRETMPGNVLVDGCAAVELERQDGERWVAEPVPACTTPTPALEIKSELTLSTVAPSPGTWRARVTWGVSCTPGLPLPMAACGRLGVATSAPFVVNP